MDLRKIVKWFKIVCLIVFCSFYYGRIFVDLFGGRLWDVSIPILDNIIVLIFALIAPYISYTFLCSYYRFFYSNGK